MRSPETATGDRGQGLERRTVDHVAGRGVVAGAVARAVELVPRRGDHALLVRADRAERDDLSGGRLRDRAPARR